MLPDGTKPKHTQMRFAPNSGYAFAVGQDTWHSADTIGRTIQRRGTYNEGSSSGRSFGMPNNHACLSS